jgi:hypothetical protein
MRYDAAGDGSRVGQAREVVVTHCGAIQHRGHGHIVTRPITAARAVTMWGVVSRDDSQPHVVPSDDGQWRLRCTALARIDGDQGREALSKDATSAGLYLESAQYDTPGEIREGTWYCLPQVYRSTRFRESYADPPSCSSMDPAGLPGMTLSTLGVPPN